MVTKHTIPNTASKNPLTNLLCTEPLKTTLDSLQLSSAQNPFTLGSNMVLAFMGLVPIIELGRTPKSPSAQECWAPQHPGMVGTTGAFPEATREAASKSRAMASLRRAAAYGHPRPGFKKKRRTRNVTHSVSCFWGFPYLYQGVGPTTLEPS